MKHLGTKRLETERLVLRPYIVEDAQAMYDNWCSDAEVTKFLTWPPHESVSITKEIVSSWVDNYKKDNWYQWAIVVKENGDEPIGGISVVEFDEKTKMAHIGYCISKEWWHKGITSEALKVVMDYLFDEVGVNRVESRHDPRNLNSGRVMKKCGMKYEGTRRQSDWNNQGICDACYYGILRSERKKEESF